MLLAASVLSFQAVLLNSLVLGVQLLTGLLEHFYFSVLFVGFFHALLADL